MIATETKVSARVSPASGACYKTIFSGPVSREQIVETVARGNLASEYLDDFELRYVLQPDGGVGFFIDSANSYCSRRNGKVRGMCRPDGFVGPVFGSVVLVGLGDLGFDVGELGEPCSVVVE